MKKIRYPSSKEIEWFHDRILELTGGEHGNLSKANLEFVLERVREIGEDLQDRQALVKKAAFLLHGLVTQHPFINGNKRTAVEVVETFLDLNGYLMGAGRDEIYRFLPILAAGHVSIEQVEDWIATNLAKKTKGTTRQT